MSMIIVGGGMTGLMLALVVSYLTKNQFPIDLIEYFSFQDINYSKFDDRAIALSKGTCQHLSRIGIWKTISDCATPIKKIHISDHGHAGFITLDSEEYHIDAFGQVVQLNEVRSRLFELLCKAPKVSLHCPARVNNIIRNESAVNVILNNGTALKAKILVAADGSCSAIAARCGIKWKKYFYDQVAVIANISTTINHNGRAWECFTKHGPIAILPISNGYCSLVWCHPIYRKDEVLSWSNKHFCNELQKSFGWKLGRITYVGKRTAHFLMLTAAIRSITHRTAVVGNAAQTLHPIAGQGFNLGLRDIISLGEILAQAWYKQQDCGSYSVLSCYQQHRQSDRAKIISITNFLVTLFSNHWMPLVIGRNIGMIAMEILIPVRCMLVKRILNWIAR